MADTGRVAGADGFNVGVKVADEFETFAVGHVGDEVEGVLDGFAEVVGDFFDFEFAGFDFGEVEDVVDDGEEGFARGADGADEVFLGFVEFGFGEEAGHADDAVHGGADFVRHVGEELAFGFGGVFGADDGFAEFGGAGGDGGLEDAGAFLEVALAVGDDGGGGGEGEEGEADDAGDGAVEGGGDGEVEGGDGGFLVEEIAGADAELVIAGGEVGVLGLGFVLPGAPVGIEAGEHDGVFVLAHALVVGQGEAEVEGALLVGEFEGLVVGEGGVGEGVAGFDDLDVADGGVNGGRAGVIGGDAEEAVAGADPVGGVGVAVVGGGAAVFAAHGGVDDGAEVGVGGAAEGVVIVGGGDPVVAAAIDDAVGAGEFAGGGVVVEEGKVFVEAVLLGVVAPEAVLGEENGFAVEEERAEGKIGEAVCDGVEFFTGDGVPGVDFTFAHFDPDAVGAVDDELFAFGGGEVVGGDPGGALELEALEALVEVGGEERVGLGAGGKSWAREPLAIFSTSKSGLIWRAETLVEMTRPASMGMRLREEPILEFLSKAGPRSPGDGFVEAVVGEKIQAAQVGNDAFDTAIDALELAVVGDGFRDGVAADAAGVV